jgi:hypothetical protein
MDDHDLEVLFFQTASGLDGRSREVQIGRRNRQPVPLFHPNWAVPDILQGDQEEQLDMELLDEVAINLTPVERQTWRQILDGRTIPDIARDQGVSHAAIYIRIRGKDGTGGMVSRNPYVRRWWRTRQERHKK